LIYFVLLFVKGGNENGKDGPTSQAHSNSEELQEIQNKTVSKQVLIYHIPIFHIHIRIY